MLCKQRFLQAQGAAAGVNACADIDQHRQMSKALKQAKQPVTCIWNG